MRMPFPEMVGLLKELLGAPMVAYLGSVGETRAVNQWAAGERGSSPGTERRLRLALQIVLMIEAVDGASVARAWMSGANPFLEDEAPAQRLREGDLDEAGSAVLGAARSFVATG